MSNVFVVDTHKRPLSPIHPGEARRLLTRGKAAVLRQAPFTIILKEAVCEAVMQAPLRLKIDPGSRTTGLALLKDVSGQVIWAAELSHRGELVHKRLAKRQAERRGRRSRHTRYRPARFDNRRRSKGWLPPSLRSRIDNVLSWVGRIRRWCPLAALSCEVVRFDTQALVNPEIKGVQYQQGSLLGYELREYLLLKWGHQCAYCQVTGVPLQVEHIVPRARNGSDGAFNLTLACQACNQRKGNRTAAEFGFAQLQAQASRPMRDAAAVNSTRWELFRRLQATGLPLEIGTGGRTKYNRSTRGIPKRHWLDAACVGESTPEHLHWQGIRPLSIRAMGRQRRQMCLVDEHGFPRTSGKRAIPKHGFRTGDLVRAVVPGHLKNPGVHVGRMASKAKGSFTITTRTRTVTDIGARYCTRLQRADGYAYQQGECGFSLDP